MGNFSRWLNTYTLSNGNSMGKDIMTRINNTLVYQQIRNSKNSKEKKKKKLVNQLIKQYPGKMQRKKKHTEKKNKRYI